MENFQLQNQSIKIIFKEKVILELNNISFLNDKKSTSNPYPIFKYRFYDSTNE